MKVVSYDDSYYDEVNKIIEESFNVSKSRKSYDKSFEFVALNDNQNVVGYFILNEMYDIIKNFKYFHVDYVCVKSTLRGQGIGKIMMEYAIEYAKKNGYYRLELTSSSKRIAAHKLYLSLGFEIRESSIFRKELV